MEDHEKFYGEGAAKAVIAAEKNEFASLADAQLPKRCLMHSLFAAGVKAQIISHKDGHHYGLKKEEAAGSNYGRGQKRPYHNEQSQYVFTVFYFIQKFPILVTFSCVLDVFMC